MPADAAPLKWRSLSPSRRVTSPGSWATGSRAIVCVRTRFAVRTRLSAEMRAVLLCARKGSLQAPGNPIPERIGGAMLVATTLLIGLYPRLLLDLIGPALDSPLFDGLKQLRP